MLEAERKFEAPPGFLQMPGVETGTETFEVTIPEGLQLSLVDLATPEAAVMSGAEIEARPPRGSTGRVTINVSWSHPVPMGAVTFQLRVYASPDGTPPPVIAPLTEPGSHKRLEALVEQDAPVDVAVNGPLAETFREQILERGGQLLGGETQGVGSHRFSRPFVAGYDDATILAIVAISLAVIAAICIVVGFATFGAVLLMAMQKGYNIEDAGYKVAVGEGNSRQEHEMVFNIRKPVP